MPWQGRAAGVVRVLAALAVLLTRKVRGAAGGAH
jgi:hypothetical protein